MDHVHEITNHRMKSPGQCFDSNKTTNIRKTSIVDGRLTSKKHRNVDNLNASMTMNSATSISLAKSEAWNNFTGVNGYSKIINDLIPYPSSSISTTIEKGNNNNNSRNDANAKSLSNNKNRNKKSNKKIDNTTNHSEQDQSPTASQDLGESQTTICDGDLMKIVKSLIEKKETCTQTDHKQNSNQYIQVNMSNDQDDPNIFDLRRSNQTLRGQLEQLNYIIEEMSKERSNINLQIHSIQKLTNVKQLKIDELNAERDKCLANNDELKFALKNYENLIHDYKNNLAIKSSENEHLNIECSQLNLDKTNLQSQLEQYKSELAMKENLINQLNNLNSQSQSEIQSRNSQLGELNQQLNQANLALQNLAHHRMNTEIELNQLKSQLTFQNATGKNPVNNPIKSINTVINLRANCLELKDELNQLKNKLQYEKFDSLNQFNLIGREMSSRIQLAFNQSQFSHQQQSMASQQLRAELEGQIDNLNKINDQLSQQKLQQIELLESENRDLKSELNQCRLEFNSTQETNNNLQRKFSALSTQYGELNQRNYEAKAQFQQCQTMVNKIQSELNERDQQLKGDADQINILKEENGELKTKVAQFAKQSDLASEYQREIEQLKQLHQQLLEERKMEKISYNELVAKNDSLKLELKSKQDKISNLNSNIQLLTKKYREFLQMKNEDQVKKDDEKLQTSCGEETEIEPMIADLNNLQANLAEKNILIQAQTDRLHKLEAELGALNHDKKQVEEEKNLMEKSLVEKDVRISELQNELEHCAKQMPAGEQQISSLNSDLTNEKNRSKGLSQSLFNEKRLNKKLKAELGQLKRELKDLQIHQQSAPLSTTIDQEPCQDEEALKLELVQRIHQLKQLLLKKKPKEQQDTNNNHQRDNQPENELTGDQTHSEGTLLSGDNNLVTSDNKSGDDANNNNSSSSQTAGEEPPSPTHSNDDFIIQILGQSEEIANFNDPPLSKLHSSVEDLKQELNNLKKTFLES